MSERNEEQRERELELVFQFFLKIVNGSGINGRRNEEQRKKKGRSAFQSLKQNNIVLLMKINYICRASPVSLSETNTTLIFICEKPG